MYGWNSHHPARKEREWKGDIKGYRVWTEIAGGEEWICKDNSVSDLSV